MSFTKTCPYKEICIIPQLKTNPKFEEAVCDTPDHILCVDFIGQVHPVKDSVEWNKIKTWLQNKKKELGLE